MKKTVSLILSVFMLCGAAFTGCAAGTETDAAQDRTEIILHIDDPSMTVNGTQKAIDAEGTVPVIVNDRTLLPVRAVVEEMGGTVAWNGETEEVTLNLSDDEIKLTIDSTTAYLNGEEKTLDTAPAVINDRTMLPIRFIAESFEFSVEWEEETQKITLTKAQPELPAEGGEAAVPEEETDAEQEEAKASKTLVVYFSATGNTKKLAEKFAAAAGADLFEIVPEDEYTKEDLDYNSDCRANREQNDDAARPAIAGEPESFDAYDTIIIGHPIWWGTIPRIIYTFMDTYDLSGKDVYMFCTSGSSGISTAVSDVRKYAAGANVVDGMRGTASTTEANIKEWLEKNGYKATEENENE